MVRFLVYLLLSLPLIGAYAMLAIGIVVVFRASKVLNLAHGAMAMLPAFVVYEASRQGVPMAAAVPLGIASGALLGVLVERFFVRPLARQGPTAQTVGTIAVYGIVVAGVAQVWGSGSKIAPRVFPAGGFEAAGIAFRWGQLGVFFVALVSAAAFFALFRYSSLGLKMRGAAENPRAAALMGINPDRMARTAWMLGGGLAALAGILLAGVTNVQPYSLSLQMLPAFVAALIGGLASLPGALVGAVIVGAAQGVVPAFNAVPGLRSLAVQVGMPQLILTVIAFLVMYFRGGRFSNGDTRAALAVDAEAKPHHAAYDQRLVKPRGGGARLTRFALLFALLVWPAFGVPTFLRPLNTYSILGDAILAGQYFVIAASIVMLTGWVGQISLAQASFVGIGAFGSALTTHHLGIEFPYSLLPGVAMAAGVSALLGVVALRVRGLYLAVATLIFAWMADEYLFVVPWFAGKGGSVSAKSDPVGLEGTFPFFDFTDRTTFYYVMLAAAGLVFFCLLNLRDSKSGRAFAAVRGSEAAAASLGIDVVRYKLLAFAAAGAIAGVAGNLMLSYQVTIVPEQFSLRASLLFLAIPVVGGLTSLGGAVAASVLFAALSEVFFRVPALGEYLQFVSAALLALMLLGYPGGLAALPRSMRRLRRWLAAKRGTRQSNRAPSIRQAMASFAAGVGSVARSVRRRRTQQGSTEAPGFGGVEEAELDVVSLVVRGDLALGDAGQREGTVLEAVGVTVRFGGLTAVQDAGLSVGAGQIVGLIGPNGAGKTTLFNAISGLNSPTSGRIMLFGEDVTALSVHQRAACGLGRTFQVIQLFPELTVFENLLVATHLHNRSGFLSHLVVTSKALRSELAAEESCRRVVRFLGLQDIADRPVAGLPFGTLRMVEIGRALVTGAPVLMLDEPASGLDNAETDKLSELLLFIRERLGLSILLIEHDVRMVTAVTDYIYVLNRGAILAQGLPIDIQRDPAVVAAYLGEPVGELVGS